MKLRSSGEKQFIKKGNIDMQFKELIREMVRTNYQSLNKEKMKVIIDHYYGSSTKQYNRNKLIYKYSNGYKITFNRNLVDGKPSDSPYLQIDTKDGKHMEMFHGDLPPTIQYILRKYFNNDDILNVFINDYKERMSRKVNAQN